MKSNNVKTETTKTATKNTETKTTTEIKKVTIDDIYNVLTKIDSNATKGFKGGCDYVQILGDTVATRVQVFLTATKIDVYCGNLTTVYEHLTDDNTYKRDIKQRLISFKGNNRLEEFSKFIIEATKKEETKKATSTKKAITKKATTKTA